MRRFKVTAVVLCGAVVLCTAVGAAQHVAQTSAVGRGKELYLRNGCNECHGTNGEGSVGPKLAPNPIPFAAFTHIVRNPINVMPVYTARVLPQADLANIYLYLSSIPRGKSADEIPLLRAHEE